MLTLHIRFSQGDLEEPMPAFDMPLLQRRMDAENNSTKEEMADLLEKTGQHFHVNLLPRDRLPYAPEVSNLIDGIHFANLPRLNVRET